MGPSLYSPRIHLIVTGTSGGIGLATVKAVLEAGHRAAATTRKSTPAAPLAALLATYGPSRLLVVQHDPSSADATSGDEIVNRVDAHFGRLDVVVNNAGYGLNGVVESIDEAQARMQLEVNFWDPARISRAAVRYFREHNTPANGGSGGRIIQVSSSGGFSPSPTLAHYSASKFGECITCYPFDTQNILIIRAALNAFSEALHKELDPAWNIKLIVVQPGGVRTDWAGASMNRVPLPPAYADPNGIPAQFRKAALDSTYMNDADKGT